MTITFLIGNGFDANLKERIDNNPNEYFIYDFPWARSLLK